VGELKQTVMPILQHGVERSGKVARHTYRPTIVPPRDAAKVYTDDSVSSAQARVETASYEPEVEKFGHQGIEIAETLFQVSSQLAMRVLTDEYDGTYDRKTLIPIFMRSVCEAFRDGQSDTDFWHDYVAYWLAAIPGMMQKWVPYFLAKARELTRRGIALYPEVLDGSDPVHTTAARWQLAVGEAARAFQRVEPNFQERRRKLAFHFIHLMNNRLGLMAIEEAYFATLIGQHEKGFRHYDMVTVGHHRS
jgi:thiopeptide-type bacteriocin biosynthesis protein